MIVIVSAKPSVDVRQYCSAIDGLAAGEGSTDALIGVVVAAGMTAAKTDQDLRR